VTGFLEITLGTGIVRATLLDAVLQCNATAGDANEYGQRYILDFESIKGDRTATIRSAWIVRRGESFPRLTTCYA
jgi:hypothetical protein